MYEFLARLFVYVVTGLPMLMLFLVIIWLFIKVCKFVFKDLFRHA